MMCLSLRANNVTALKLLLAHGASPQHSLQAGTARESASLYAALHCDSSIVRVLNEAGGTLGQCHPAQIVSIIARGEAELLTLVFQMAQRTQQALLHGMANAALAELILRMSTRPGALMEEHRMLNAILHTNAANIHQVMPFGRKMIMSGCIHSPLAIASGAGLAQVVCQLLEKEHYEAECARCVLAVIDHECMCGSSTGACDCASQSWA
jgi:hypothetical protein